MSTFAGSYRHGSRAEPKQTSLAKSTHWLVPGVIMSLVPVRPHAEPMLWISDLIGDSV
jgi:hypothetical protein